MTLDVMHGVSTFDSTRKLPSNAENTHVCRDVSRKLQKPLDYD